MTWRTKWNSWKLVSIGRINVSSSWFPFGERCTVFSLHDRNKVMFIFFPFFFILYFFRWNLTSPTSHVQCYRPGRPNCIHRVVVLRDKCFECRKCGSFHSLRIPASTHFFLLSGFLTIMTLPLYNCATCHFRWPSHFVDFGNTLLYFVRYFCVNFYTALKNKNFLFRLLWILISFCST